MNEEYKCKFCNIGKVRPIQFSIKQALINCDNPDCESILEKWPWECIISRSILSSSDLCKYERESVCSSDSSGVHSDLGSSTFSQSSITDREVELLLQQKAQLKNIFPSNTSNFKKDFGSDQSFTEWHLDSKNINLNPFGVLDYEMPTSDKSTSLNNCIVSAFNEADAPNPSKKEKVEEEFLDMLKDIDFHENFPSSKVQDNSLVDQELESWLDAFEPTTLLSNGQHDALNSPRKQNGEAPCNLTPSPSKVLIPSFRSAFSEVSPCKSERQQTPNGFHSSFQPRVECSNSDYLKFPTGLKLEDGNISEETFGNDCIPHNSNPSNNLVLQNSCIQPSSSSQSLLESGSLSSNLIDQQLKASSSQTNGNSLEDSSLQFHNQNLNIPLDSSSAVQSSSFIKSDSPLEHISMQLPNLEENSSFSHLIAQELRNDKENESASIESSSVLQTFVSNNDNYNSFSMNKTCDTTNDSKFVASLFDLNQTNDISGLETTNGNCDIEGNSSVIGHNDDNKNQSSESSKIMDGTTDENQPSGPSTIMDSITDENPVPETRPRPFIGLEVADKLDSLLISGKEASQEKEDGLLISSSKKNGYENELCLLPLPEKEIDCNLEQDSFPVIEKGKNDYEERKANSQENKVDSTTPLKSSVNFTPILENSPKNSQNSYRKTTRLKGGLQADPWSVPEVYLNELNIEVILKEDTVKESTFSAPPASLHRNDIESSSTNSDVSVKVSSKSSATLNCSNFKESTSTVKEMEKVPCDKITVKFKSPILTPAIKHNIYKPVKLQPEILEKSTFSTSSLNYSKTLPISKFRRSVGYASDDAGCDEKPDSREGSADLPLNGPSKYFGSVLSNIEFDENFCLSLDDNGSSGEHFLGQSIFEENSNENLRLNNNNNNNNNNNSSSNHIYKGSDTWETESEKKRDGVSSFCDDREDEDILNDVKSEEQSSREDSDTEIPVVMIHSDDELELFIPAKNKIISNDGSKSSSPFIKTEIKSEPQEMYESEDDNFSPFTGFPTNLESADEQVETFTRNKRRLSSEVIQSNKRIKLVPTSSVGEYPQDSTYRLKRRSSSPLEQYLSKSWYPDVTYGSKNATKIDCSSSVDPSDLVIDKNMFIMSDFSDKFGNLKMEPEYFFQSQGEKNDQGCKLLSSSDVISMDEITLHDRGNTKARTEKAKNKSKKDYFPSYMSRVIDSRRREMKCKQFNEYSRYARPFTRLPSENSISAQTRNEVSQSELALKANPSVPDVLNLLKNTGWAVTPCNPGINYNIEQTKSPTIIPVPLQTQYGNMGSDVVFWSLAERDVSLPNRREGKGHSLHRKLGRKNVSSFSNWRKKNFDLNDNENQETEEDHWEKLRMIRERLKERRTFGEVKKEIKKEVESDDECIELPDDFDAYQKVLSEGYKVRAPKAPPESLYIPPIRKPLKPEPKKKRLKPKENVKNYDKLVPSPSPIIKSESAHSKAQDKLVELISDKPSEDVPDVVCMKVDGKLYVYHRKG